ncbi:MAG: type VI secretion system baseplate subunit TssG [Haliea sp.]|nr:MAG: type VI secretion system baseplate subunit TssG [Haliea sp.]
MNTVVANAQGPATAATTGSAASLASARAAPWCHGFLPLLRQLAATHADQPDAGHASTPRHEPWRLGQHATLAFAPREIAGVDERLGRPLIRLFSLGLLGPNGPLPLHDTEAVRDARHSRHDETLADFLDIFHHRAFSHLYRAWRQAQAAAGLDRAGQETFTPYIARLAGDDPADTPATPLAPHARWASAAHRIRQARNPEGLVATLSNFFGIPVTLEEYQLHWITIETADRCAIGSGTPASALGHGALLGAAVPDRQNRFRLTLGPLSLAAYLRFTPQAGNVGKDLAALVEWVRAFVGFEYAWEVALLIRASDMAPSRLGGPQRLGWSAWMAGPAAGNAAAAPLTGMVFEAEHYMRGPTPLPAAAAAAPKKAAPHG